MTVCIIGSVPKAEPPDRWAMQCSPLMPWSCIALHTEPRPSLSLNTAWWAEEGRGRSQFAKRLLGLLRGLDVINPPDNSVTVGCGTISAMSLPFSQPHSSESAGEAARLIGDLLIFPESLAFLWKPISELVGLVSPNCYSLRLPDYSHLF